MNYVLQFLNENRRRLNLAKFGLHDPLTCVIVTPRFRASAHVVVLVLSKTSSDPILVAKTPRLADAGESLQREATNLEAIQGMHPDGFSFIPKIVSFESYCDRPILVQTALNGTPMDPPRMRRDFNSCCQSAINCLTELHRPNHALQEHPNHRFDRLVKQPLDYLASVLPWNAQELERLQQTRELVEPLRDLSIPDVIEHGDCSHPNVMWLKRGGVGIVDWEMAEIHGLPCTDLMFFLTFATFAKHNARENGNYLPAIRAAFFGKEAWANHYVAHYAHKLGVPTAALTPLFLLCWVRYLAGLLRRLTESDSQLGIETANWLRQNRYFAIWQHSVTHANELLWAGAA